MNGLQRALASTGGTKFLVGVTGAFLTIFVLGHMLGNLQIFLGPEAMNGYAAGLKAMPGPLWAARLGLLAALLIHVVGNVRLNARNKAARPTAYANQQPIVSSFASRTMLISGLILLAFIIYHLAHFTLGLTDPANAELVDPLGRHDAYSMVVLGFQQPLAAGAYLIAMALLFLHLAHGVASLFQTAGLRRFDLRLSLDAAGRLFAIVVVLGNITIVLACLLGVIEPAQSAY